MDLADRTQDLQAMKYQIYIGSNLDVLPTLPDNSVDSIVTDPPYELGFMGKAWDASGIAYNVTLWRECLRVLKPGGHLLAFSGSRTYHRMTCAIEDAGFEVRDQIMWVYGSGFPKSHNISKAFNKESGVAFNHQPATGVGFMKPDGENGYNPTKTKMVQAGESSDEAKQWDGWGTALKPAHEPICVARKPLEGTVVDNVRKWGVGGLNIDGCRVGTDGGCAGAGTGTGPGARVFGNGLNGTFAKPVDGLGRWPANLIHDGSQEVLDLFPGEADATAARFFYCAKASKSDRNDGCDELEGKTFSMSGNDSEEKGDIGLNRAIHRKNFHPTVKPTELMAYLCRLVTPPGGTILDPFMGSGSTGRGAVSQGFKFIGIELSDEYAAIAEARIRATIE